MLRVVTQVARNHSFMAQVGRLSMWEKLEELIAQVIVVGCALAYLVTFIVALVGTLLANLD